MSLFWRIFKINGLSTVDDTKSAARWLSTGGLWGGRGRVFLHLDLLTLPVALGWPRAAKHWPAQHLPTANEESGITTLPGQSRQVTRAGVIPLAEAVFIMNSCSK